jgi:prephenate dehydrogenase
MIDLVVIGLGLIGGSVALAAKQRGARVVGIDVAPASDAAARGGVSESIDAADEPAVQSAVRQAELVVLCTPVRAIMRALPGILEHARVATDCGSTKREIARVAAASARAGRFVPGHPMAGGPEGGLAHARADLFEERSWIICPEASEPDAVAVVERLITELGARAVRMSAAEHDRAVALTSHVPQLVASALTLLSQQRGASPAEGPAFTSATRVAGGPASMWQDIFETNADEVADALEALCQALSRVRQGLATDAHAIAALELLQAARAIRRAR